MQDKTKKIISTVFLLFFLATLIIGFTFPGIVPLGGQNEFRYGKFKFSRNSLGQYSTYVNDKEALFNFLPPDVADVLVEPEVFQMISGKYEIDITADSNSTFIQQIYSAQFELGNMLNFHRGTYIRAGLTGNNTDNVPVISCNQSSALIPVIYFVESNATRVYNGGQCIIAEGASANDIVRIKDRLLYGILGVTG